jgi:hypothetical protein
METNTEKSELKPCPVCGGEAYFKEGETRAKDKRPMYIAGCYFGCCNIKSLDKETVFKRWNRRTNG